MPVSFEILRPYGFGSQYYGKQNFRVEDGNCPYCGYSGALASYDTGHFFTLLFFPVLAFKPLHIYNECPECKKYEKVTYKSFSKRKKEVVAAVEEELQKAIPDSKKVANFLKELQLFQDPEPFSLVAANILNKCRNRFEILSELLASFRYYNDFENAQICSMLCYEMRKTDDQRVLLAELLLYNKKPNEAEELLGSLLWNKENPLLNLASLLVEVYCSIDRYVDAIRIYNQTVLVYNSDCFVGKNEELKQLIDRGISSGEPIASDTLQNACIY